MSDAVIKDFASWRVAKSGLIEKAKDSVIIERIADVIRATDYLYNKSLEQTLDADDMDIFHTGFLFLNDQFATLEEYLSMYFDDDINEFMKFGPLINLLLYIEDFSEELYQFTKKAELLESFANLEDDIDTALQNRDLDLGFVDEFNFLSDQLVKKYNFDYVGILEVFTKVCEHYGLYDTVEK